MKLWGIISFVFCSLFLGNSWSQVQLFEQGSGGLVFRTGGAYHPSLITGDLAFEYNVEGKMTLGAFYGQVVDDTLFEYNRKGIDSAAELSGIKTASKIFGGYGILELLEPDKLFPLSFSFIAGYTKKMGNFKDGAGIIQSDHNQTIYSGGPQFGARFFVGATGSLIPTVEYVFSYVRQARRHSGFFEKFTEETEMWHDINGVIDYTVTFSGKHGLIVEAKAGARYGDTDKLEPNASFHLGYFFKFRR